MRDGGDLLHKHQHNGTRACGRGAVLLRKYARMRQLFVPACLCLMTFTGSTGEDLKLSLEQFTGASVANAAANSDKRSTREAASSFAKNAAAETTGSEPYAVADIPI